MSSCLFVIDAQESFRHRPYFTATDLPAYLAAQNALINDCLRRAIPIIRIFHVDEPALASNPFAMESGHVVPLAGLRDFDAAATFYKHRHSALVGTGLQDWMKSHCIEQVMISGIRTEQCCETTARHASDLGYEVAFYLDATLTWDMQAPDGSTLDARAIQLRTATVLQGRFASIESAADLVKLARSAASTPRGFEPSGCT